MHDRIQIIPNKEHWNDLWGAGIAAAGELQFALDGALVIYLKSQRKSTIVCTRVLSVMT